MKYLTSQLSSFFGDRQVRRNLGALRKYLLLLFGVITLYAVVFHFIMLFEGQRHSWLTGFYWTLTVMSTLGFGDITFHSDLGRMFSIVVLVSGVVLLLIMLPFAFIRYFYAPWLEAQIRMRAPRSVPPEVRGHAVICRYDSIAPGLIRKLEFNRVPYCVLEPDPVAAARMMTDGISVIAGEVDSRATYERLRVSAARMVFANAEDATNTNITLTVREVDPQVPVFALAEDEDSIDILELSGATQVLPLKRKLGEHLAARISGGAGGAFVVGRFEDLELAEFIVHDTPLAGKTLAEAGLAKATGVHVVGLWQRGQLLAARPDSVLSRSAVPVAIGTREQVARLDGLLGADRRPDRPVLILGGGKVGLAAGAALQRRRVRVHVVEKMERLRRPLGARFDRVVIGDAADREVLEEAGLEEAGAVVLTTNEDAINIHLTVYCRRLKPELTIASRITHERNIEAIYRAGADAVLSYASLGREHVVSLLLGREPIMVGEGGDFFLVPVPESLAETSLGDSGIGERTGLIVIAVADGRGTRTDLSPATLLPRDGRLLMLGTAEQRQDFSAVYD